MKNRPVKKYKVSRYLKFSISIIIAAVTLFTAFSNIEVSKTEAINSVPQTEVDDLNKKIKEAQQNIDAIKKQKEEIEKSIASESQNQKNLANSAKQIENSMQANKLSIDLISAELSKLEDEVNKAKLEKQDKEKELKTSQEQGVKYDSELKNSINLYYKMSLTTPGLLEQSSTFESSIINNEKQKALVKIIKSNIERVNKLQAEIKQKVDEVAAKEKQISDIQNEKQAQSDNLSQQQAGLAYQVKNKNDLIEQSKQSQENLADSQDALKKKEAEERAKYDQYQQKLRALMDAVNTNPAPPSGTYVAAGTVVGYQGRTGLSCEWAPGVAKSNNYCQAYAGLSSEWYYYDPVQYPSKGSHLHFEYVKNGRNVDPSPYLQSASKEFVNKPFKSNFVITQGYRSGHQANDLVAYHGAPVYAVKPGKLQYYCDGFAPNPAYMANIVHDDGTRTWYVHLQKPAGATCKKLYG